MEENMDEWEKYYDKWKITPPERRRSSKCICCICKEELFPDEEYYELEGDIYCEDCADNWLKQQRNWVTEDMAYGDR